MKKLPPYHIRQQFLNGKLSPKSIATTMNTFKNGLDYAQLAENLPNIFSIHPKLKGLIWGELFPHQLGDLGTSNHYYFVASDAMAEIEWVMVQVAKNRKQVAQFVSLRDQVFNHILLGDYSRAESVLDDLRQGLGLSVWYYEMRILILSLSERETEIYPLLEQINRAAEQSTVKGKTGFVPFLTHFFYLRSSESTAANFDYELERQSKRNRNSFQSDRFNYYKHRLNYFATMENVEVESPLIYEATNALVDRYQTLVSVLRALFITNPKKRDAASDVALRLYRLSKDAWLLPLVAWKNGDDLPDTYDDPAFLSLLNAYYRQDYNEALKQCREYVKQNPNSLDTMRIYVQSLIQTDKAYQPIHRGQSSLANEVSRCLFEVLSEQSNNTPLLALANLNKRLYGLPIAGAIHAFLSEQGSNHQLPLLGFTYSQTFDPLYAKVWNAAGVEHAAKRALAYLRKGEAKGMQGIVTDYYKAYFDGAVPPEGIASYRTERDKAESDYQHGDYQACIDACQRLLQNYGKSLTICQMAAEYIFKCYEKLGLKKEAIAFYVEEFIKKQSHTNRVRLDDFVQRLRNERYKGLKANLDSQIFILLNAEEDEQKAMALEKYMSYLEVEDTEGLIEEMKLQPDQERVEYFLTLLMDSDVMRHLTYIESTSQMLEEQQKIAQYLTSLDSDSHDYYVEYNKQLIEQTLIYSNIEKLDESRIYVNAEAIVKYDLTDYENLYVQLKEIAKTTMQVGSIYLITLGGDDALDVANPDIIGGNIQTTKNSSIDIASQLFNSICHKYLFSKFGLKTYLSTRIRHGVLEGELRSVFDSRNLVLLTEGSKYRPTDYWQRLFALNRVEQEQLMNYLADFSRELLHTIESFKEEVLQIRTADDEKGMFDYRLPDERKSVYVQAALSITDNYQDFCREVIAGLNMETERSLEKIREAVRTRLGEQFDKIISELEKRLESFNSKHFFADLRKAVSDSRADLQGKLVKIEKWFTLQSGKFDDFELERQLELVWEVIARQYPNLRINARFDTDDAKVILQARYYRSVADVLTIIYNNMFNHGSTQPFDNVAVIARRSGDQLRLHFENLTVKSDEEVNDDIKKKLESNRFQLEHGSGLSKVKNIVVSEFGGSSDDFSAVARGGKCHVDLVLQLEKLVKPYEDTIG